ncbi:MAG TPA: hypothetical protein VLC28_04775, partial [Flavitalea sp.]|nr:hypothetical protein [Flavitalea sp.]
DETNLSLKGPKKICTIQQENVGIFKIEKVIEAGLAYFSISADNTKMLVVSKSSANLLQTFILDNALDVVKQGSLPVKFTEYTIPSAVLTPDNKICLILKADKETAILCANADGKKVEVKYNSVGNQTPYFTRAKLSKDGNSIYIYSTSIPTDQVEKEEQWCNGFLISQLDCHTLKISKPLSYEFTPEMIQNISQKGGGIKHKREYLMYTFDPELHELSDGTVSLVGSPETTTVSTSSSAPNSRGESRLTTRTTLTVGPVVAFYPAKNGRAFEYVIIPRRINLVKGASSGSGAVKIVQSQTVSHSSAGFISSVIGDEMVILYNDNLKNIALAEDQKPVTADGNGDLELVEAVISKDKKLAYRKLISETQKKRYTYFLGNSIPSSSSSIIFPLGKEGIAFNARDIFFTNWCFITMN